CAATALGAAMLAAARQFRISSVAKASVLNMSRAAREPARKGRPEAAAGPATLLTEALPRSAVVSQRWHPGIAAAPARLAATRSRRRHAPAIRAAAPAP